MCLLTSCVLYKDLDAVLTFDGIAVNELAVDKIDEVFRPITVSSHVVAVV